MTDDEASCGVPSTAICIGRDRRRGCAFPSKRRSVPQTSTRNRDRRARRHSPSAQAMSKAHQALDRSCFGDIMSLAQALVGPPVHALWFVGK